MKRRQPISTLFPYTTLFRSVAVGEAALGEDVEGEIVRGGRLRAGQALAPQVRHRLEDRKSTRLNSSHGSISYAVFCLKKKKKMEQLTKNQAVATSQEAGQNH